MVNMSRLIDFAQRNQPTDACRTCLNKRVVTVEGRRQTLARRCPTCFQSCDECGGSGYSFVDDWTGAPTSVPCVCLQVDQRIDLFNAARVPRRYAQASLGSMPAGALDAHGAAVDIGTDMSNANVKRAALDLVKRTHGFEPGSRGIGLIGPVGCGKTHLMAGLVRELTLENGIATRFVEFTHLLAELREGFDKNSSGSNVLGSVVDAPVLVIDEMGKGLTTDWQLAVLDELVSKRYNAQVSTFFTSNYPVFAARTGASSRERFEVTTLEDRIGARMFSRLLEMCDVFEIDAPDYRKQMLQH